MAVPPRAANLGAARGGLAADKRAPHLYNGKIELILILALKEATAIMALTSIKVTTKYNHRPELTIIRSAHSHTDKPKRESEVHKRTPMIN
jgi:hypothetical protein